MSVTFNNTNTSNSLVDDLNILIASYQVISQNVHGFHWNMETPHFFSLHAKTDEIYSAVNNNIDVIAERVRQLESFPIHTMTEYLEKSKIEEAPTATMCKEIAEYIIKDSIKIISLLKEVEKVAMRQGDIVTSDIMIEITRGEEKNLWMIRAFKKNLM